MAKYTATKSVTVTNSIETAIAALEVLIEAIDVGKKHLTFDILPIEGGKYAAWTCYTAED